LNWLLTHHCWNHPAAIPGYALCTLQLGEPPYQNANVELPEVDASRAAAPWRKPQYKNISKEEWRRGIIVLLESITQWLEKPIQPSIRI
jgi:hypothetical protein